MGLKDIQNVNPYYLTMFLRSKFGFQQLLRIRELTIQYQLTLDRVRNILVYLPTESTQKRVEDDVQAYIAKQSQSRALYHDAEQLLLDQLGLRDFSADPSAYNVKSARESFLATGRLDAEYYQPKYDYLLRHLSLFHTATIGELVDIHKSVEPGSEAYKSEGVPFVRVSDLSKQGLQETSIYLDVATFSTAPKPRKGTILLSKDGSVGIAYKVEEDLNVITSSAILHLTVRNTRAMLPDYLTLVLNSIVVAMQAERDAGGSVIQHWKPSDIERVVVPILPLDVQQEIAALVRRSFALQDEAKRLLDEAKLTVEQAIEFTSH